MVNLLENWLWKMKDYSITVEALLANQIYVLPSRHSPSHYPFLLWQRTSITGYSVFLLET